MLIRPAHAHDLAILSEYWYDAMALIQQTNPRIRLLPNARQEWEAWHHANLALDHAFFLVAEQNSELVGGIYGRIVENEAGLNPRVYGVVQDLLLDLHAPQKQQGVSSQLWQALQAQFLAHEIHHISILVNASALVPQAFWRALGARKSADLFWMNV